MFRVAGTDAELSETWARLMALFMSRRDVLFTALAELGLTPPHGVALMALLHGGPTRMRDMAEHMACDASYITTVADRLEELGLAERRSATDDRRAKELALTPKGETVARRIDGIFAEPPATMEALSADDRAHLARIVRTLADVSPDTNWMPPLKLR
jgi:DNA-binding MarR family transcriptional regulator